MSRPVPSGWAMFGGPVDVEPMRLDAWVDGAVCEEDVGDGPTVRVVMTPVGEDARVMAHEWTDLWVGV